jgi:hypothetical protein
VEFLDMGAAVTKQARLAAPGWFRLNFASDSCFFTSKRGDICNLTGSKEIGYVLENLSLITVYFLSAQEIR